MNIRCVVFLLAALMGNYSIASTCKHCLMINRLYLLCQQYQKYNRNNNFAKIEEKNNYTQTRGCSFTTGGLFYHAVCDNSNNGDIRIYDKSSYRLLKRYGWHTNRFFPQYTKIVGDLENGSLLQIIPTYNNQSLIWWSWLGDWGLRYYFYSRNDIRSCHISPSGNQLICVGNDLTEYQKRYGGWENYKWTRTGGKHTMWIDENTIASIPDTGTKVILYSVAKEPSVTSIDQGESFNPQETCVSKDAKTIGIVSTYKKDEKPYSRIKLYDIQSQEERGTGVVNGSILNTREGNVFLEDDNLVIHTEEFSGDLNSYTLDTRNMSVVKIFKHSKNTKKVGGVVSGYFPTIEENKVTICDIKNLRNTVVIAPLGNPTHVALDPEDASSKAIVALNSGYLFRFNQTKIEEIEGNLSDESSDEE